MDSFTPVVHSNLIQVVDKFIRHILSENAFGMRLRSEQVLFKRTVRKDNVGVQALGMAIDSPVLSPSNERRSLHFDTSLPTSVIGLGDF